MLKVFSILAAVFSLIGLGLCTGAGFAYRSEQQFLARSLRTEGVVLENLLRRSRDSKGREDYSYAPRVRYETSEGRSVEFVSSHGSRPAEYAVGDQVAVLYLPANPQEAQLDGFLDSWGLSLILAIIGVPFLGVGLGFAMALMLRHARRRELERSGKGIAATYVGIERNNNISSNGRSPWRVLCQWQNPATSQVHVFKSDDVWFDPTPYLARERLRVLINPNNPKLYMVDLSFLPTSAD